MSAVAGEHHESERFSSGYEIEPFPGAHPGQDAPFATYPARPRVALSRPGLCVQGRYAVPLTGDDLVDVVTRVVHAVDRLAIIELDSTSAHLARTATTAFGAESIILRFVHDSVGHTRIDGVDRSVGVAGAQSSNLHAVLEGIARALDARADAVH
jgi:hypothetical protein